MDRQASAVKTRRRRPLACASCRQRKLRCDRQQPCGSCTRAKDRSNGCSYAEGPPPSPCRRATSSRAVPQSPRGRGPVSEVTTDSGDATQCSDAVAASAAQRAAPSQPQGVSETWHSSLVAQLLVASPPSAPASAPAPTPEAESASMQSLAATKTNDGKVTSERGGIPKLLENLSNPINAIMVKTRYMMPSSWLYSILLVPHNLAWHERLNEEKGETHDIIQACKSLNKRLKALYKLPWVYGEYCRLLPSRAVADILVDNYLRTFETVHRIVHVPTFKQKYELLWADSNNVSLGFVIQAQLCCALGALIYDDSFSLRPQAMQWAHEAGAWLESSAKPRLMVSTIQTMCLHRLARECMQETYGDRVWMLSGTLLRAAMSIGLHRDPQKLPEISRAQAEMRRRLWTTVLELALSSCQDPGAAPLISTEDYDCALPSNYDDGQLDFDAQDESLPRSTDQFTDSSLQIALGRSLPVRLAIARFCSALKPDGYEQVLKLSAECAAARRTLSIYLRSVGTHLSDFVRQYCEMVMCRYIFSLHIPYMVIGAQSPAYMLSRKACVDAAVSLAYSSLPLASTNEQLLSAMQAMNVTQPPGSDFVRLCICGAGPYRSVIFQAAMVIAAELVTTADESQGSLRWPDGVTANSSPLHGNMRALELLSLLRVANEWTVRRLRVGGGHNKDHLFVALAISSIEALMNGTSVKEAMEESGRRTCYEVKSILEELTTGMSDADVSETQFGSEEDDFFGTDDMWLMQVGNFDLDFSGPILF